MPDNREDWLKARLSGIGASEAAAVLGKSPYMSNVRLWEIKTGRREQEDISGKPFVKYGVEAEAHLRALFALDFPQYEVSYDQFGLIRNRPDAPFLFATLDGALTERETGRRGVLEIKTTEILRPGQWDQWDGRLPEHYYIQVLHQLLATGFDFAILKAQIKQWKNGALTIETRHYAVERPDVPDDLAMLEEEERRFWDFVREDRRPSLRLPDI